MEATAKILKLGNQQADSILRTVAKPVSEINDTTRQIISEMREVVDDCIRAGRYTGLGLAAPQIGYSVRIFIVKTPQIEGCYINPVIRKRIGRQIVKEQCLSFKGIYSVVRPDLIKFTYMAPDGKPRAGKFHDYYAAIIEHEIDHLDGILACDKGKLI